MKTLSVEQQIEMLRPGVASGIAHNLHHGLLATALALLLLSIFLRHPVPLMIAVFLGVVGLCERRAGPNIVAAVQAYDSCSPAAGQVSITITSWDSDNHYHALVRQQGLPDWGYEFIPQGWQPVAGIHPARIWRSDSSDPPVLAAIDAGILIPRGEPKIQAE